MQEQLVGAVATDFLRTRVGGLRYNSISRLKERTRDKVLDWNTVRD